MSNQANDRRRVWSANEINEQLDQVAEVLVSGASEFVKGFLFGAPRRPRPKPEKPDRGQS